MDKISLKRGNEWIKCADVLVSQRNIELINLLINSIKNIILYQSQSFAM